MLTVLAVVGYVVAGVAYAILSARGYTFLRGVRLSSMPRAAAKARRACRDLPKLIQFGLWLPIECLAGSFLLLGAARSGKTVLLNLFRRSLLPLFQDPGESILVVDFDPKRDSWWPKLLPRTVPYFDLSPSVQGCGIDLFGDAEHDGDLVTIAGGLLPEVRNDHQPHFRNTAVLLLVSILRAARWHKHRLTLRRVVLLGTDLATLRRYLKRCPLTAPVVTAHLTDGDEAMSVFATLSSGLNRYRTVAAAWNHADRLITLTEFLSFKKAVLNLPYEDDGMEYLEPILRLILLRLEQKVLKQNKRGRRVVFLLDEFRVLRNVRFNLLAAKGAECGVTLVTACQSKVGAAEAHGDPVVKELFGLAKNRIVLRQDGYDDAKFGSDMFGQSHGFVTLHGKDSWSESAQSWANAEPGEIQNLPIPGPGDPTVRGYITTPYTGPSRLDYSFGDDLPFLNHVKTVRRLPNRPPSHFDLSPLTAAERRELGLV